MPEKSLLQHFAYKSILIVEDEYFLADETRRKLEHLGSKVIGPTARVSEALDLIGDQQVDAAILDVHLGDELVFPVAERLAELDIPFVFATGYDPSIIPVPYTGFALCEKPTELENIAAELFAPQMKRLF
ncbi:CheY-like chemotaxis protein [Pseudorhizobium tarimense]|uniref:CheY-like chemotaxis protein n=1 Tax=Pseudorhizobium tarimense TaxID=1079109 RepID=A0ABV2H6A3_9HYPH|nr:response regulator [Pseudorhizobium tarimense]MCJ8519094.1 response regulator [Pseudorhizobium tarimense]